MHSPLPRALFHGLFLGAVLLGLVEALHLGVVAPAGIAGPERALAALYVLAPFAVVGLATATLAAGLAQVWARARRVAAEPSAPSARAADASAGLFALVVFAGLLFGAARLVLAYTHNRALGASALAVGTLVAAAGAFYTWVMLRAQLARLDEKLGSRTSLLLGLGAVAFGASLMVTTVVRNDALAERLGGWLPAFAVAYPLVTAAVALALHRFAPRATTGAALRRGVLAFGVICAVGALDLVHHMDARAPVKRALLEGTLAFRPLVTLVQPLFDADGDGYAGLLGGGDCDDGDPAVNPGAREIPRNGVDDDCFGGDSPGTRAAEAPEEAAAARAAEVEVKRLRLAQRPNLVLITVDTLRADHLGYHGYPRATSPRMDALAQDGLRFTWAIAQGPQTKASMPSLFTGRYFSETARTPELWARQKDENVMLAERLRDAGYKTAGIPAHRFFLPGYGLDQGFEDWDLTIVRRFGKRMPQVITSQLSTERAVAWLTQYAESGEDRPFFLWVHYFDPHHYYQDHPDLDFGAEKIDLYDEEIRHTDRQIGKLVDWLRGSSMGDETYLLLHSDHGEGFFEHGYGYHGQHLFNDQIRVPLILVGPGLPSRQIDTPVPLLDVTPTLLELAGAPRPPELRGRSLLGYATERPPPPRPVFSEMVKDARHSDRRVIIDWPWKLQYGITFGEYTLYNLAADPNEQEDVAAAHPAVFERLQSRLRQWMSEEVEPATPRW